MDNVQKCMHTVFQDTREFPLEEKYLSVMYKGGTMANRLPYLSQVLGDLSILVLTFEQIHFHYNDMPI